MTLPKSIQVSVIPGYGDVTVEINPSNLIVTSETYKAKAGVGEIMKGIEVAYRCLGYEPDLERMWLDDAVIMTFHLKESK